MIKTCYIVGAGSFDETTFNPVPGSYIIAADGGYLALKKGAVIADLVIGDFDSLEEIPASSEILRAQAEKDDTDMFLAVRQALVLGYERIYIYGGLGGRLDHSMANFQTLAHISKAGAQGYLVGEGHVASVVSNGSIGFKSGMKGYISIFSMGNSARGVTLVGLKYPLNEATITNDYPIGVSNEFLSSEAQIIVKEGILLIIWQDQALDKVYRIK